jgi:mannosyltransferase
VPFGAIVDNGILAGRLAAAVCGAVSAGALYGLGREASSRTLGVVAGLLWALSPFTVFFSRIAADDALLTLLAILTTWASVCLARRPTPSTGALCGLCLALAAFAKTTGVLLAAAPVLAIVMLGRPLAWRSYVRPLLAAFVVGLIVSAPLLLGVLPLLQQVALHTGSSGSTGRDLLWGNLEVALGWAETFVGYTFMVLAGAGILLALVLRRWGLVFVALFGIGLNLVLLYVTTPLFARYLLFLSYPAYLLAAYPIERASSLASRLSQMSGISGRVRLAGSVVVVALGLVLALGRQMELLVSVVRAPTEARIPGSEHMGYVENWFAV